MSKYKKNFLLILILFIALLLRLWGVKTGLPQLLNVDEAGIIIQSLKMAGTWGKPNVFSYGTLFQSGLAFLYSCLFLIGKLLKIYNSPQDFLVAFLVNPAPVVILSRVFTVLLGVVLVYLVYWVGIKIFNKRVGLLAALFIAVSTLLVKESHYAKNDILSSIWVWLVYYQAAKIVETKKIHHYVLGGIFLGLGITTKYYPMLALPLVLIAHVLKEQQLSFIEFIRLFFGKRILILIAATVITIIVSSPYLLFVSLTTLKTELRIISSYGEINPQIDGYSTPYFYSLTAITFLTHHFLETFGWPIFISSVIGFYLALKYFQKRGLLLLLHPVLFILTIDIYLKENVARYGLHVLPFIAVAAAVTIDVLLKKISTKHNLLVVFIVFPFIFIPLLRSLKIDLLLDSLDTRLQATKFIETHIPFGSKIAVEGSFTPVHHAMWGPALRLDPSYIFRFLTENRLDSPLLDALTRANQNSPTYDLLIPTLSLDLVNASPTNSAKLITDIDWYREHGIKYFIVNQWFEALTPTSRTFLNELVGISKEIAKFRPTVSFDQEFHGSSIEYSKIDAMDLRSVPYIFGPEIAIYKIKYDPNKTLQ